MALYYHICLYLSRYGERSYYFPLLSVASCHLQTTQPAKPSLDSRNPPNLTQPPSESRPRTSTLLDFHRYCSAATQPCRLLSEWWSCRRGYRNWSRSAARPIESTTLDVLGSCYPDPERDGSLLAVTRVAHFLVRYSKGSSVLLHVEAALPHRGLMASRSKASITMGWGDRMKSAPYARKTFLGTLHTPHADSTKTLPSHAYPICTKSRIEICCVNLFFTSCLGTSLHNLYPGPPAPSYSVILPLTPNLILKMPLFHHLVARNKIT